MRSEADPDFVGAHAAITFALYGWIPHKGDRGLAEFVSHGADCAAVTFEFEAQGGAGA